MPSFKSDSQASFWKMRHCGYNNFCGITERVHSGFVSHWKEATLDAVSCKSKQIVPYKIISEWAEIYKMGWLMLQNLHVELFVLERGMLC